MWFCLQLHVYSYTGIRSRGTGGAVAPPPPPPLFLERTTPPSYCTSHYTAHYNNSIGNPGGARLGAKLPKEAKPPHQHSQPQPSPATWADILSVSLRSTWGACLRAYSTSCTNTDQRYECTCNSGYTGNAISCSGSTVCKTFE